MFCFKIFLLVVEVMGKIVGGKKYWACAEEFSKLLLSLKF